jgi:2-amino-4-hydroxy-6-hydroxymethyldihydropteridine diphosphokinase
MGRLLMPFPLHPSSSLVFIALGSNLGDSRQNIRLAMDRLQEYSAGPILKSSLWQSSPADCPPGSPPFINAVTGLVPRPDEVPESLLATLQSLERQFGRGPKIVLNEPRRLDLDLILFGPAIRRTPQLVLPHPRAHERRFVLQPLSEIAPDLILPGQIKTVAQLLADLPPDLSVRKVV